MYLFITPATLDAGRRNVMRSVLMVLLLSSALCHGQSSDKTDIVELENGTVVVGEIKELHRGLLVVSTDGMSTINIEWGRVVALSTDKNFTVEAANGFRAFGTISTSEDKSDIVIGALDSGQSVTWPEVVVIQRIKDSFSNRYRTAFNTRVRREIVKKPWFDISLYYLADSNPPQQNAITNPDR